MTGSAKTTRREFLTKACELSAAGFVTAFAWGSLSLRDANARWSLGLLAPSTARTSSHSVRAAGSA